MDVLLIKKSINAITNDATIVVKENGEAAWQYLQGLVKEESPDWPHIIITDINMPRINGLELLGMLKGDKQLSIIPTILFSGSEEEGDIRKAYEMNVSCYIVKPFDVRKYQSIFKELWGLWSVSAKLPRFYSYAGL